MKDIKVIATNRKARYEYTIEDTIEAGVVLVGTELRSARDGSVSLSDGYVISRNNELWLLDVHISANQHTGRWAHEPKRPRKLLLHRKEIIRLVNTVLDRGYSLIPLRMYFLGRRVKVEIGVAKGKHQYDKREAIAKRDEDRQLRREWKEYRRD